MWLRQIKRYTRSKSRIIGSLGQPLLVLFALGFGLGPVFEKAGQGNYVHFLTPGMIGMSILFVAIFYGMDLIWDRQFGFLKETLVAPVSRVHIMIGRTLGGATVAVLPGLIVFLISLFLGTQILGVGSLLLTILFMFLISIFFTALGTALASSVKDMQGFQLIMSFVVMPVYFLSGALFPLEGAPALLKNIAYFNPLAYGVDGLRVALLNAGHFGALIDVLVLGLGSIIILFIGGKLFERIQV